MTSASLPLPSSSPLSPGHSLPRSASLPFLYRSAFFFPPSPLLSIPLSQRWRASMLLRRLGPNVDTERTPPTLRPSPAFAAISLAVSSHCVLRCRCCLLALPPPHLPVRVSGSRALGGGGESRTCLAGELCRISHALPRHPLTSWISPILHTGGQHRMKIGNHDAR